MARASHTEQIPQCDNTYEAEKPAMTTLILTWMIDTYFTRYLFPVTRYRNALFTFCRRPKSEFIPTYAHIRNRGDNRQTSVDRKCTLLTPSQCSCTGQWPFSLRCRDRPGHEDDQSCPPARAVAYVFLCVAPRQCSAQVGTDE